MNPQASRSLKPSQRINFADPALKAQYGDAGLTHRHGGELCRHGRLVVNLNDLPEDVVLLNGVGERIDMYNNGEVVPGSVATNNIAEGVIDNSGRLINPPRRPAKGEASLAAPLFNDRASDDNPYVHTGTGYRNPSCYHSAT